MTTGDIRNAISAIRENHDGYLGQYMDFLSIPSVSTDPSYGAEVRRAAEWVRGLLSGLGFSGAAVMETRGNPVVYGERADAGPEGRTVLVYAHYDVQPVDPIDLWETPPFEPTVRGGRLYARGAVDDKFGVFAVIKALEIIAASGGALPLNVKLLFEGEEETGSPNLGRFIEENRGLLSADLLVVCDGAVPPGEPSCTYTVRGIIAAEVTVRGPERDYHSGKGGAVRNPIHAAADIISSFHDENGTVMVPGFYDGASPLTADERAYFARTEGDVLETEMRLSGRFEPWGEPGLGYIERTTARPSLDVNGIHGGYQGKGTKTVIPAEAGFKVSMRLAPGQDPDDIWEKFAAHVRSFDCPTARVSLSRPLKARPALLLRDSPVVHALVRAYREAWGCDVSFMRMGGSLPLLGMFEQVLGMPMIVFTVNTGGGAHSPNEYMEIEYFDRNIETAVRFFDALPQAMAGDGG